MNKKLVFWAMLAGLLALGLVLTGCPTDGGGGAGGGTTDAFAGTWKSSGGSPNIKLTAGSGTFTGHDLDEGKDVNNGTYTVSGNSVTMKIINVNLIIFSGGSDTWKTWAELTDAQKATMGGSDTVKVTITGNQIIVPTWGQTLIKQ